MRYGSVCSGIEAATQAWHPLGWTPVFFSEVDKFPSAVLAHHYGSNMPGEAPAANGVPNLGDMTKFEGWPDHAIDLLVGGTPCQDYSIAGLRLGLDGSRGQLTLVFVEILGRYRPTWFAWENVPGVLSSNEGEDFARFLGDLSGQKIDVPETGWQNAGIVAGIPDAYGLAWRVLDAQFTRTCLVPRAVPQRRRRVFVVGYLGDWRCAAAVLFDGEGLQGNSPPRRQAGQGTAGTLNARTQGGGGLGTDFELGGGLVTSLDFASEREVSGTVSSKWAKGAGGPAGDECQNLVAHVIQTTSPTDWAVRRLMPIECERLQGFSGDFTRIPWRGRAAELCPDGPRYKALGNSMAVNVMHWLGERIEHVNRLIMETAA